MPSVSCRQTDTLQMQKVPNVGILCTAFPCIIVLTGSTIASAFKRVLLSSDETLQLSGVQCVSEVLSHHPQYGQTLLRADIAGQKTNTHRASSETSAAEFMFEALSSKKEPLML